MIYIGMSDPSMYNNCFTFSLYISNGTDPINMYVVRDTATQPRMQRRKARQYFRIES